MRVLFEDEVSVRSFIEDIRLEDGNEARSELNFILEAPLVNRFIIHDTLMQETYLESPHLLYSSELSRSNDT